MVSLYFWATLLLYWQQMCLPMLAVPQPGWAPYRVHLNSAPLAANKLSSLDSDLPLESLTALTPPEEPGGFVYPDSSVPTKMLSPPQRFAGQLSPQLEKVATPPQGLRAKLRWQERLLKLLLRSAAVHTRPAEVTLPPPNLTLGTVGPLDPQLNRTPQWTAEARVPPTAQKPSSQPADPAESVTQPPVPPETGTLFPVSLRTALANPRAQLTKGNSRSGLSPAKRPGFRARRSLKDSPPGGFPSAPGNLSVSAADSASGSASAPTHIISPGLPSLGVGLETQLNYLLQPLIPDDSVRWLIVQLMSILKTDCAELPVSPACAKLISKSRHLLMLLTEQQEATVSQAQREQQQLYSDPVVTEGTEAHGKQKGQQTPRMFREHVLKNMYIYKWIIGALAALLMIMILVIIALCVRKRRARVEDPEPGWNSSEEAEPTGSASYRESDDELAELLTY